MDDETSNKTFHRLVDQAQQDQSIDGDRKATDKSILPTRCRLSPSRREFIDHSRSGGAATFGFTSSTLSTMRQPWKFPIDGRADFAMLIILGIFFRFFNLDHHPYWGDEFFSLLRLSGYTQRELIGNVFTGTLMQIRDLNVYQSVHNDQTWLDTVHSLAIEDAQHPPLYYVLLRLWSESFRSQSVGQQRAFRDVADPK